MMLEVYLAFVSASTNIITLIYVEIAKGSDVCMNLFTIYPLKKALP